MKSPAFALTFEIGHNASIGGGDEAIILQYGERVCKGGDMYEQEQKFYDFVATRPLASIEQWAKTLACPVIRFDGTRPVDETMALLLHGKYAKEILPRHTKSWWVIRQFDSLLHYFVEIKGFHELSLTRPPSCSVFFFLQSST
ncbi:MAG: hypothetical protein LBQ48_04355 [Oscillospiraceae bacterium]|jgi:hypothetical protein|nr:hypothetical protein [Oscillospiraceae bacterium]